MPGRPLRAAGIAMGLLLPVAGGWAQPPAGGCTVARYHVVALPMSPAGINDAGQVAGTTRSHRAALWSAKNGLLELPLPPGYDFSEAAAINARGHIVGMVYDRSFTRHRPFIYANDVLTLLEGEQAHAYQIADGDEVAGEAVVPGKTQSAPALWINKRIHLLATCCGGVAKRIIDHGAVVGDAYDEQGHYHAYMGAEEGGLRRIGPPDGFSSAAAANDRGHTVIEASARTYLYADGQSTRIELPSKFPKHAHAINGCDIIVGSFGPFSDADRAFAWERSSGFQDLNTRIPSDSGWKLESATAINNRGEIAGKGDPPGDADGGFLLVPE